MISLIYMYAVVGRDVFCVAPSLAIVRSDIVFHSVKYVQGSVIGYRPSGQHTVLSTERSEFKFAPGQKFQDFSPLATPSELNYMSTLTVHCHCSLSQEKTGNLPSYAKVKNRKR